MITRTTETAFRILIDLGLQDPKRVIPLAELHGRVGGSQTYLAKVTAALTRARIIRSNRGAQGGLLLARVPSEIRLLDVVAAIQGLPTAAYCDEHPAKSIDMCGYHHVMMDLHQSILSILGSRTIADLLVKPCGKQVDGQPHASCHMLLTPSAS